MEKKQYTVVGLLGCDNERIVEHVTAVSVRYAIQLARGQRGPELSVAAVFEGHLCSVDDGGFGFSAD